MNCVSEYLVPYEDAESEFVEKRSRFISHLWRVESEAEARKKIFKNYQINAEVMSVADKKAMVMHCLPAHRGEEITEDVLEAHANEIFDEAENRLHVQKAVLVKCLKD